MINTITKCIFCSGILPTGIDCKCGYNFCIYRCGPELFCDFDYKNFIVEIHPCFVRIIGLLHNIDLNIDHEFDDNFDKNDLLFLVDKVIDNLEFI